MPQARFFCRTGGLAGSDHLIGAQATIGRDAENSIVLPAGVVSKRHARIVFDEAAGAYTLEDLRSRTAPTSTAGLSRAACDWVRCT